METCIGHVTHYFNHLSVAALSLNSKIKIDDMLHFWGHSTDFYQQAWSLEIDHHQINLAEVGADVAIKVAQPVREGDKVFLVTETEPGEKKEILFDQLRGWENPVA
jgi:hypothetical protein